MSIAIRKFEEKDIPLKVKWINDEKNNRYLHYDLPLKEEKTLKWFRNLSNRTDRADYTIIIGDEPIGLIGLLSIDLKNMKAEYYICLGEEKYKGRGIAQAATKLLIYTAYKEFGLNKIYLYTEISNVGAQRLFERAGFVREGLSKNDIIHNGQLLDRYVYGLNIKRYMQSE